MDVCLQYGNKEILKILIDEIMYSHVSSTRYSYEKCLETLCQPKEQKLPTFYEQPKVEQQMNLPAVEEQPKLPTEVPQPAEEEQHPIAADQSKINTLFDIYP